MPKAACGGLPGEGHRWPIPDYVEISPDELPWESIERDIFNGRVTAMRRLQSGDLKTLADERRGDFRVVITDDHTTWVWKDGEDKPYIGGQWMDWPEKHWKIGEAEYKKLPIGKRASLEAREQLTRWVPQQFEARHKKFWLGFTNEAYREHIAEAKALRRAHT